MRILYGLSCALVLACSSEPTPSTTSQSSATAAAAGGGGAGGAMSVGDGGTTTIATVSTGAGSGGGFAFPMTCEEANAQQSSVGCDFWTAKPDVIDYFTDGCLAVYVANSSTKAMRIDVERKGTKLGHDFIRLPKGQGMSLSYDPYDPNSGVPAGGVAILFLAHMDFGVMPDCPAAPAIVGDVGVEKSAKGDAFRITTDQPAVAYQAMPYGGGKAVGSSATMLLPVNAWHDNYVAVTAHPQHSANPKDTASVVAIAHEDDTKISVVPVVDIEAGSGIPATAKNSLLEVTLKRGEYLQLSQGTELGGSAIQSSKPIGLFGAQGCLAVPTDVISSCDCAHQMIPPVRAMGSEYVAVRHPKRKSADEEEKPPWRLVGAVDGTKLTYEPQKPTGAPDTLAAGQVATFETAGPFVVRSQDAEHPFYAAGYMRAGIFAKSEGDQEWVNVVPALQFLDRYIFFTDPSFPETALVVVRPKGGSDVKLACKGTIDGWKSVANYEYAYVSLVTGNFQDVDGCSNGRQQMESDGPFGVTVWGLATPDGGTGWASYAYPGGAGVRTINSVEVPAIPK